MASRPTVIDLFAGAGGLSLGAARAGFDLVGAVEKDPHAFETHKLNFPNSKHSQSDISGLTGKDLFRQFGLKKGTVTGVIGGPPCQGFSIIGRRSLTDTRNDLFGHFYRLVSEIAPAFFVAENVPGILNEQYSELRKQAESQLDGKYVLLEPFKVKASEYGVPTIRTRVFFIGFNPKKIKKGLTKDDFTTNNPTETVCVKDALAGLPEHISPDWQLVDTDWTTIVKTNGSSFMTKAAGEIPPGIGNKEALEKYSKLSQISGCQGTTHKTEVIKRFQAVEQGKQDKISKAMKLKPDGFCPTLRAGTGSDKGSYQAIRPIHYNEPRVITPREAARLQGFPDWFVFHPTKWHSFRQIGNSVSPVIAEYLLKIIRAKIDETKSKL